MNDMDNTKNLQMAIEKTTEEEIASLPQQEKLSGEVAEQEKPKAKHHRRAAATFDQSRVSDWFFTFMCMNIPVIGWIYLMYLAFNKKRTDRRNFARAYMFYKLVFLMVAIVIVALIAMVSINLLDQLLAYMQML